MIKKLFHFFIMILLVACKAEVKHNDISEGWKEMESILARIKAPVFAVNHFLITDYGARPRGFLCTDAFRMAIEACHEAGGGKVIVPADSFLTGAIHLLSNVNLHLEEGAVILFSTKQSDYLPLVRIRSEGLELYNFSPLVYAYEQENIAITGKGTLDGQAAKDNWWIFRGREQYGWKEGLPSTNDPGSFPLLFELAEKGVPVENRIFGEGTYFRPSFVMPFQCKNILIEGITIVNPPMWMLHPVLSENITIRGVKLLSKNAPNGDGCNPESCKDILIEECIFSTGDDCIAIKSGRNRQGYESGIPTENVIIRKCKMMEGHGGVVLGSELSGGIRNVFVYDCDMDSPDLVRALRLKSNKYRGGVVENIYLRDIRIGQVKTAAIHINQNYGEKSDVIWGPENYTVFRNIFVENMTCGKSLYAIEIYGVEQLPVENVKVINSTFHQIERENKLEWVKGLVLENVIINGRVIDSDE